MNLFTYKDYRTYLRDLIREEKRHDPSLTITRFASRLDCGGSTLKMVLTGTRNLTAAMTARLAVVLNLNFDERDYFENLVAFNQSATPDDQAFYRERLQRLLARNAPPLTMRLSSRKLNTSWLVPALTVYLMEKAPVLGETFAALEALPPDELEAVAAELRVSPNDVKSALRIIEEIGLFSGLASSKTHIRFERLGSHDAKLAFQRQMVAKALTALDEHFHARSGFFNTHILSLSPARFRAFAEDFKRLVQSAMDAEDEDLKDVYQLSLQCFPLLRNLAKANEEECI